MSEIDSRPAPSRGRSSTRGGRGGFGRGGPRGGRKPTNGTGAETAQMDDLLEDQGELGEMKKKYSSELPMLKDMFPDWTDVDLVFALEEANGDVGATAEKISEGYVSQFAEVKKNKDRARSKAKDEPAMAGATDKSGLRGGRGRGGFDSARGGRGRGSDRGRGGTRGGRGGHATTNGTLKDSAATSVPTQDSTAWDNTTTAEAANGGWDTPAADTTKEAPASTEQQGSWGSTAPAESTIASAVETAKSSLIPEGVKKSWASMFSKPDPPPAPALPKQAPASAQPAPIEEFASSEVPPAEEKALDIDKHVVEEPITLPSTIEEPQADAFAEPSPVPAHSIDGDDLAITPSKDPLTEENVEHLPDQSNPPATQTVASTVGSVETRNLTPLPGQLPAPIGTSRPPMGGYAASAYRATGQANRSASYQRRVQEQQEAVVMPGHNAVDRAAVQFGSMGLSGEPGLDVDEEREEPETQQALQHSPPSQPRTSLPPAPRQAQEPTRPEGLPTPKQAPGLPPASEHNQQQMQNATMAPGLTQDQAQMNPNYAQYGRYPQQSLQQDNSSQQQQKPYDPFSQQIQQQYDHYGTHQAHQQQQQSQQPSHAGFGGLSSAPNEYQSYYTSNEQQRNAYNQYYGGGYGQQDGGRAQQLQHEAGLAQHRSASGFGTGPNESAYGAQAQQQVSIPTSLRALRQSSHPSDCDSIDSAAIQSIGKSQYSILPGAQQMQPRTSAIHPDLQVEVSRLVQSQSQPNLGTLETLHTDLDDPDRQAPAVLSSPIPTTQSRYGETPGSGHNTPNPHLSAGQPQQQLGGNASQQAQQQQMHQAQGGHPQQQQPSGYGANAGYPYGHPYYQSPYQTAYQNQFGSQYGGGYGGGQSGGYPSGNKQQQQQGGMYGAPSGYGGMGAHSSYDQHSSSPANAGAFGQNQQSSMRSASGMSSGLGGNLDDYSRSAMQTSQQNSGFGGLNDPFARSTSGFGAQGGYGQQSMGGQAEDTLKPYNDTKSGPSPALGQPGRPGSAANSAGSAQQQQQQQQSGLQHQQSQQSGFGGYGGFPSQAGGQYGGLGGLGSHQQQQQGQQQSQGMGGQGGYAQYGAGGFGQTYGNYGSRGGWGSNYGAH
ncbi:RNAPII degradation factor [Recurvomyces mirabilis]|uniref:RNA polymerase II degradation factor 1 n=1 Tax=Recurvomyces mirabilis TaxID=574656 RepID=A0AAE0WW93_9PEZI|nr:RNAPII degradation factor [Recurvomyces mirabilis]KAK5159005.1 RNAPII degradation factor [Recurvomyces mirabilis]